MRKIVWLVASAGAAFSIAYAADWSGAWRPLQASYTIYSGELAEREPPTATERTMAIAVEGPAAKEIFDSIGPDLHPTCSQGKGDRERRKRGVDCIYEPLGAPKGYRCWIGINLRTGESTPTVSC
jgi:hypothetical protein